MMNCFSQSVIRELAMTYVRSQNLNDKSPTELAQLYESAYQEIMQYCRDNGKAGGTSVF